MRLRWLALALLLLLPLRALAETCTFSTSGSWTAANAYSGTDDCTLDATDSIVIASGVTATIPADASVTDIDVAMTTGTITVASGGTLVVEGAGGLGVPNGGLVVQSGGTFRPAGSAVSYGDATPTLVSALADGGGADVNTVLPVGKIIHCPGATTGTGNISAATTAITTDCPGALTGGTNTPGVRSQVAICYPDSDIAAERLGGFQHATAGHVGEGFYPEWLGAVKVGDVAVFWDSTNQNPSRDVNAMYEIEWINLNSLNRCIGLNVRQGSTESSCEATALNCHLTERDIREATLQAAYVAGQRTVSVDTAAVTATYQRVGHHLTCPLDYNADGTIEPGSTQTVAITQTTDGGAGADTLRLMPGGFRASVPSGAVCWIDYGWQQGDPISVFRPARIANEQNSTCVAATNPVACCTGANVGACGPVTCQRGATCDLDFALFHRLARQTWWPGTTSDNTWLRELSGSTGVGSGSIQILLAEGPGPFHRQQLTSPACLAAASEGHAYSPSGNGTSTLTDSVARHWGDDLFVSNSCVVSDGLTCTGSSDPDTANVHGIDLKRFRAEYHGCVGASCSVWDEGKAAGGATVFSATDILLRDATEHVDGATTAFYLMNGETAGSMKMRNSVWIGNIGQQHVVYNGADSRLELRNFYDIGRVLPAHTAPMWEANVLADGSIIEPQNTGSGGYVMSNVALDAGSGPQTWERLLVLDADMPGANPIYTIYVQDAVTDLTVTDFAMISPNRTGQAVATTAFRVGSNVTSTNRIAINRLTMAMRPGEVNEYQIGVYASGDDTTFNGGYRTLVNGLGAYWWPSSGSGATINAATGDEEFVGSPWCFVGNDNDTGQGATLTSAVRDTRQPFVNPWVGNFEPKKSSDFWAAGCGARRVGASDMWALRVLGHDIYAGHGDTWKRPTGGGSKRGPRATP